VDDVACDAQRVAGNPAWVRQALFDEVGCTPPGVRRRTAPGLGASVAVGFAAWCFGIGPI